MPQVRIAFDVLDLGIGDRRLPLGVPVDQSLAAIDQPLAIERDEDFAHRGGEPVVHREARALPIGSEAERAKLLIRSCRRSCATTPMRAR